MNSRILLVTNDFGPRAGGIETFVIGLLERVGSKGIGSEGIVVYTSRQDDMRATIETGSLNTVLK